MSDKFFIIENKHRLQKIPFSDIYYIKKIKNTHNVCIEYVDGVYIFKNSLQEVLNVLDDNFVQCNRSLIANVSRITRIDKHLTYTTIHFDNDIRCLCYKKVGTPCSQDE